MQLHKARLNHHELIDLSLAFIFERIANNVLGDFYLVMFFLRSDVLKIESARQSHMTLTYFIVPFKISLAKLMLLKARVVFFEIFIFTLTWRGNLPPPNVTDLYLFDFRVWISLVTL